ncbi:DNA repair protein rad5 [Cyphellophora attinorum]|uniref:DNA repair protein rad5 n=1 Tax=Cyphellophora attinorum TaxID=1664694 RepID=A0A0N0NLF3_9EURO|nr:DNA repair protein rad5 [Phialophora attinorum]KPI38979.1 DNA repair protein rad5 [Phialophora attinorum]
MDVDQRPTKKRRFFVDDPEDVDAADAPTPPTIPSSRPSSATSFRDPPQSSQTDVAESSESRDEQLGPIGFDADTFRAFVGEDVADSVIKVLCDAANGNMERAINMYLDGSWKSTVTQRPGQSHNTASTKPMASFFTPTQRPSSPPTAVQETEVGKTAERKQMRLKHMPQDRYIGSFGVAGWTTKSGSNILAHGDKVRIERSKIAPKTKVGRGGKAVPIVGRSTKQDVVTRFTNPAGEEIGRLPEDAAKWVSSLIDQKVCRFEGTCVYAPERVRTNDTILLQLRAYMLRSAFDSGAFAKPQDDNRTTGLFEEKESVEEKDLRLRQVALVKLFDEISLPPTTTNETTKKHKKQGLLKAAEMAEQYDKDKASKPKNGTSTPNSEEEDGAELEEDQLDALYQKAQSFDFDTPPAEPAPTFALDLRKYQKQALHWMLSKERDEKHDKQASMHPLWEEYTWPVKDADDAPVPLVEEQDKFYVNLYSGEISLEFPVQEQNCLGGILADEMGLGKTIEIYSLIHSHRQQAVEVSEAGSVNHLPRLPQASSNVEPAPYTTLVVAPMSLLAQWESEATKSSRPGSLKTLVYYGGEKTVNLQTLCSARNAASAPHVIITSYGVVLSEFNQVAAANGDRGSHGGLFSVDFFRVILDEAHTIKNRQAKTSKACYEIRGKHRWVLTGTPIVNRLEDLFSLVRFLKVEPWSNFSFWKTFITVPFESKEFVRALNVVQTVLEPLVLRRTKDMKTPDGEALVPLPPKSIKVEEIELSKTEREVYDLILTRAKRAFNESLQAGTLLKSYTTIFAQILRLRQSCCHPVLTRNKDLVADEEEKAVAVAADATNLADDVDLQELITRFTKDTAEAAKESTTTEDDSGNFTTHALRQIQTESSGECPICIEEPMINPAVTGCWHSACKKCLEDYIQHQTDKGENPSCFSCRETIDPRDVFEVVKHSSPSPEESFDEDDMYGDGDPKLPKISLRRIKPYSPTAATSAKIVALLKHLAAQPRGTKSVVFSQFTAYLDLIGTQLERNGFQFLRFDGTMSQKFRSQVLRSFSAENAHDPKAPRVLLLSLRAGGVGLNLTAANKCYMMDPWWSFAVEAQAIDRVHRMGQTQKVEVIRFIAAESIEERMLRVQDKKMAVAGTLGVGQSGGDGGDDEKKRRRIEELEMLLG